MREKELRLALICYGGISLAIYMHGITKEVWHLARASRAHHDGSPKQAGSAGVYRELLERIEAVSDTRLRVFSDIIAGASAGGINGVFLAQAVVSGQSLDPLTDLWLDCADVDQLMDPDARPLSRMTKFWAVPIAWLASKRRGSTIDDTVEAGKRDEVRMKLSNFVRARWFEPPFGGATFTKLIMDALDAMAQAPEEKPLLPFGQPLDLIVTVTDYRGYPERLTLNSPPQVTETEHRMVLKLRADHTADDALGEAPALAFAARATASFPGAFPPFTVRELDGVLKRMDRAWVGRESFLRSHLPQAKTLDEAEQVIMIDGSVLANAPFKPAIAALKHRPARREVDRRFVYIDPKPGQRAIQWGGGRTTDEDGEPEVPGFFATIFKSLSDIPRSQPIRDNVETISALSQRIRRTRRIVDALRDEVEERVTTLLGKTLFLDRPTPARLAAWRAKAQVKATQTVGYAYASYGHLKLSNTVEEIVVLACDLVGPCDPLARARLRDAVWDEVRVRGLDRISPPNRKGASKAAIAFFQAHDLRFRIRRLRSLARILDEKIEAPGLASDVGVTAMYEAIYHSLSAYLALESAQHYRQCELDTVWPDIADALADVGTLIDRIGDCRNLMALDAASDARISLALNALPKTERREMLFAYLGFPFYDIATLALLQGEGNDEFDPIKIDRIAPDDACAIRDGGAAETLKGVQFNNFGAFFSRAYRENDYLWGRLHGTDRLIDITASTMPKGAMLPQKIIADLKKRAFHAILDEEEDRLAAIPDLFVALRKEIG